MAEAIYPASGRHPGTPLQTARRRVVDIKRSLSRLAFPPCRARHAPVRTVRRFNFTRRAMPMFLVPALGLPAREPFLTSNGVRNKPGP